MAIPSRFLKPAANRSPKQDNGKNNGEKTGKKPSQKPGKPAGKVAGAISPTVVGVALSVFAHGLLIAFGPRTNFSFAALTEAAQQQDAEDTIVPLVEISPADRARLPGFAQPRRIQPSPTGLNSLALPPGLPNTAGRRLPTPQTSTASRSRAQARSLPSATPRTQIRGRSSLPSNITSRTLSPSSFGTRRTPSRNDTRTSQPTAVLPSTPITDQLDLGGLTSSSSGIQLNPQAGVGTQNGVPNAPGTRPANSETRTGSAQDLLSREIEAQSGSNAIAQGGATDTEVARGSSPGLPPSQEGEEQGENIPITPPAVDTAAAQQDAPRLLDGFIYDGRETTEAEAEDNLEAWLAATAENKSDLEGATADIEIDSKFKVCKDTPPNQGLIGVLVNPDGSQEQAQVLRSIGYDILNRQALSAVEFKDFGQPDRPTQYQVTIDVIYQPEGCVEDLPEVE